jgi:ribonuclease P protein component
VNSSPPREEGQKGKEKAFGLPAAERLKTDREYREVVQQGERAHSPHFTLYRDFRGEGGRRIGISAGRRVGVAVVRNRIRRIVREFYRLHKGAFPPGSRTAIVVRKVPPEASLAAVSAELLAALEGRWSRRGKNPSCRPEKSS